MARQPLGHHPRLVCKPRVVNAGAAPNPIRGRAAIERHRDGGGAGGVADAHFAHHQQIGRRINRVPAGGKGRNGFGLAHRRGFGEIGGGAIQFKCMHIQPGAKGARKLVDRRPAMLEIGHHLGGDFGRKGGYPLGGNAVIARKNNDLRVLEGWAPIAAPARIPDRQILEPAQRAAWLGQLSVARLGAGARGGIGAGQRRQKGAEIGKRGKGGGGHEVVFH